MPYEIQGDNFNLHIMKKNHIKHQKKLLRDSTLRYYLNIPPNHRSKQIWFKSRSLLYTILIQNTIVGWVGVRNINSTSTSCSIEIVLESSQRNKGYGKEILTIIEFVVQKYLAIRKIIAHVYKENIPARGLFEKLHYKQTEDQNSLSQEKMTYIKQLNKGDKINGKVSFTEI
ncbi:MAG: GNAT family N-acetyltransferase [Candidatus Lokiarchaeota archaeon]|nr:GNAT family N-acetyltransferase [Candidatus Lokiarchaeota archaeon]